MSLKHIPDETTILNFRRLLEKNHLAGGILEVINGCLDNPKLPVPCSAHTCNITATICIATYKSNASVLNNRFHSG